MQLELAWLEEEKARLDLVNRPPNSDVQRGAHGNLSHVGSNGNVA